MSFSCTGGHFKWLSKIKKQTSFLVPQSVEVYFSWLLLVFSTNPLRWTVTPKQQHASSDQNISDIHFYRLMLLKLKTSALRNADFLDVSTSLLPQ